MPKNWDYDTEEQTYRNRETGEIVTGEDQRQLRDKLVEESDKIARALTAQLTDGNMKLRTWVNRMRRLNKDTFIAEYILGRGGKSRMDSQDWGRLGHALREQYAYLNRFASDINAGKMTKAQIAARAAMYPERGTGQFERGFQKSREWPTERLPAQPGEGSECLARCKCHWECNRIEENGTWECTWTLGVAEHCPTCLQRAEDWAPYIIAG